MENEHEQGKVISFINMKGGVGKTTLTKEVGYHLSRVLNKKVLLIDIDPQINLTQSIFKIFGFAQSEEIAEHIKYEECSDVANKPESLADKSFSEARSKKYTITKASIQNILNGNLSTENPLDNLDEAILQLPNTNMSIIPGEFGLDFVTRNLNGGQLENGLFNFIKKNDLRSDFEYILIDCPPTYSSYTIAALKPSDFYVVPVKPEAYSMLGVDMLEQVVRKIVNENDVYFDNKPLKNLGIIITDVKDNESQGIKNLIEDIETSKILEDNEISLFENRFSHNQALQNNMAYLIDNSKAEKRSKPNLNNLVSEILQKIEEG